MTFEYAEIVPPPHKSPGEARELGIHFKCLQCGRREAFYPTISEEVERELKEKWGGEDFVPLDSEKYHRNQRIEDTYSEEEQRQIRERLRKLGYI